MSSQNMIRSQYYLYLEGFFLDIGDLEEAKSKHIMDLFQHNWLGKHTKDKHRWDIIAK